MNLLYIRTYPAHRTTSRRNFVASFLLSNFFFGNNSIRKCNCTHQYFFAKISVWFAEIFSNSAENQQFKYWFLRISTVQFFQDFNQEFVQVYFKKLLQRFLLRFLQAVQQKFLEKFSKDFLELSKEFLQGCLQRIVKDIFQLLLKRSLKNLKIIAKINPIVICDEASKENSDELLQGSLKNYLYSDEGLEVSLDDLFRWLKKIN